MNRNLEISIGVHFKVIYKPIHFQLNHWYSLAQTAVLKMQTLLDFSWVTTIVLVVMLNNVLINQQQQDAI